MIRYLFLIVLLTALNSQALELVNFNSKLKMNVHRGEESKVTFSNADGCGIVEWESAQNSFIELYFAKSSAIPVKKLGGIIKITLLPNKPLYRVAVRLADRSGEIFHWDINVKLEAGKWQEISIPVKDGTQKGNWGGNNNKKLEYPLYLQGLAINVNRKEQGGKLKIKSISFEPDKNDKDCDILRTLKPTSTYQFYMNPKKRSSLEFIAGNMESGSKTSYTVSDYLGNEVLKDAALITENKRVSVPLTLNTGYYEISFPTADVVYGICVLPEHKGDIDSFFCMDTALSELVKDTNKRAELIKVMERAGVAMSRERIQVPHICRNETTFKPEGYAKYNVTRNDYANSKVKVLELLKTVPAWTRYDKKHYPKDLLKASQSALKITEHFKAATGAVEIWNEPDMGNSTIASAPLVLPMLKATKTAFNAKGSNVAVGGLAFGTNSRNYVQSCIDNGLLENSDYVSFHYYGRSSGLQNLVEQYRKQVGSIPLWLTEYGKAWPSGTDRPSKKDDIISTNEMIMQTVEAKACGLARAFIFVLPFYEERSKNFGMTGRDLTPLRSLTAYFQTINILSGYDYIGDLAGINSRVFAKGDDVVAVLYKNKEDSVQLPEELTACKMAGIDGREIIIKDGTPPDAPTVMYVFCKTNEIKSLLNTETKAMRLFNESRTPFAKVTTSPVIIRPVDNGDNITVGKTSHYIKKSDAGNFTITIDACNMSDKAEKVTLKMINPAHTKVRDDLVKIVDVAAQSTVEISWNISFDNDAPLLKKYKFSVSGKDEALRNVSKIGLCFSITAKLDDYLKEGKNNHRIEMSNLDKWQENHAVGGKVKLSVNKDGNWQMDTDYPGNITKWCYPKLELKNGIAHCDKNSILVIRGRGIGKARVNLLIWESGESIYAANETLFPADGEWHTAIVSYDDFSMSIIHPKDEDQVLNFAEVKYLSVGNNPGIEKTTLEISDIYVINKK